MASLGKLLTTKQAAKFCTVAPRTIAKWCDAGRIPFHWRSDVPGSERLIFAADLVAFMTAYNLPIPSELSEE